MTADGPPSTDWGVGEPARLLDLLCHAYGAEEQIRRVSQNIPLDWSAAPQRCSVRDLWTWVLGKTAAANLVLDLIAVVLQDSDSSEFHALLRALLGKRLGEVNARIVWEHGLPREAAERDAVMASIKEAEPLGDDAPGQLQAITAASAGDLDPEAKVQAVRDLGKRTAMISVAGQPRGTGFLVGENLLLTAAHVFDRQSWPPNPLPVNASAVFDYLPTPGRSLAETGIRVAITEYVTGSLPTAAEAADQVGNDWDAPDDQLDFALVKLAHPVPDPPGATSPRGSYPIYDDDYKFVQGMVYMIIKSDAGGTLRLTEFGERTALQVSKRGTRFRYGGNTFSGASGSAVVDNRGRLVGLHHWGRKTTNQGVPISVIARKLLNGEHSGLFKTGGPIAPSVANLPAVDPFDALAVVGRPYVNRSILRTTMRNMAKGEGATQVLVINGERGTGVTYSYALASHVAANSTQCASLTKVAPAGLAARKYDLREYYGGYPVGRVCTELIMNLLETLGIITERTEQVAQEAREIISVMNKIANKLRGSDKQWWLFFDSIDDLFTVQSGGVAEFICALVGLSIDPQYSLRIVLAGRAAEEFAAQYADEWVERDTANGLNRGDVEAWLRIRAQQERRQVDDAVLEGKLAELFPAGPLPEPRVLALKLPRLFQDVTHE